MTTINENTRLSAVVFLTRKGRNLTLTEAAQQIGISKSSLSTVENGLTDPQWSTVQKLLRWMNNPKQSN